MQINRVDITLNTEGVVSALRFANASGTASEIYGAPPNSMPIPKSDLSDPKVVIRKIDYWWKNENLAGLVFYNEGGEKVCGEEIVEESARKETVKLSAT